jgi:hypothetical protein
MSRKPLRRSQAISPFGIGALVNFPGPISLVHAGLDAWEYEESNADHREFRISDEWRLAEALRVDYFVEPPDFRVRQKYSQGQQPNTGLHLPFLRFPLWHVCPRCSRMHMAKPHDLAPPECKGPIGTGKQKGEMHNPRKTTPVRFVAACANGHLQDFPWVDWLTSENSVANKWRPNNADKWLRMYQTEALAIGSIRIGAEEMGSDGKIKIVMRPVPMTGVFSQDEERGFHLQKKGIECSGNNPALPIRNRETVNHADCKEPLRVLLTGATNLYFPVIASSIYIPHFSSKKRDQVILDVLDDYDVVSFFQNQMLGSDGGLISERAVRITLKKLKPELTIDVTSLAEAINETLPERIFFGQDRVCEFIKQKILASVNKEVTSEMVKPVLSKYFPDWDISMDYLLSSLNKSERLSKVLAKNEQSSEGVEVVDSAGAALDEHRKAEYDVFCQDIEEGRMPKLNLLIRSNEMASYNRRINGFLDRVSLLHKLRETRVFMGFTRINPPGAERRIGWNLIASRRKRWLPATVVRGEGIFIKFQQKKISDWLASHGKHHEDRLSSINQFTGDEQEAGRQPFTATPSFVLLHTFAHLLINELVYECGYGSSSIRERIYSSDEDGGAMNGLLIYTAAGDSDGSMGGLVEMGAPGKLEKIIAGALERARWCSSDPVCIESAGQGPGTCNLAACHSCALLPETSCEHMNRFLDRGVIVGTLDDPLSGFFD